MDHALVAIIAYLTGAVTIFAYLNRNRYFDLLLASIGLIVYGTASLMLAFGILPGLSFLLTHTAIGIIGVAVIILVVRMLRTFYQALKRYLKIE